MTQNASIDKIILAADHAGFDLKTHLAAYLRTKGIEIVDVGTNSTESVDYPDFGSKAAQAILDGQALHGIIICGTGIGISIAANRHKGIRAAVAVTPEMAELSRLHNNANLLALGARLITAAQAEKIVDAFLNTAFEGGRHARRIEKIEHCGC